MSAFKVVTAACNADWPVGALKVSKIQIVNQNKAANNMETLYVIYIWF